MDTTTFMDESISSAKIKVIGVGGCGGNAANAMLNTSLDGEVALYAVNTDAQALSRISEGCTAVQIGHSIAKGLGVGAEYKRAAEAARQEDERLRELVSGADMVFIAAGMGGGTGTGASPIIAEICREQGILTVAMVTKPFSWENRDENAKIGIDMLSKQVDSIIVVPNDRIAEVHGDDITMDECFKLSDNILSNAVAGICEIIYKPGHMNVDFADVRSVMSETGQAMMGTAVESGIDRAARAANSVIECPLLEGIKLSNARGILVNISFNQKNFKMSEMNDVMSVIKKTASTSAKIFTGFVFDEEIGDELRITLVATGLRKDNDIQVIQGNSSVSPIKYNPRKTSLLKPNRNNIQDQDSLLDDRGQPAILKRQLS